MKRLTTLALLLALAGCSDDAEREADAPNRAPAPETSSALSKQQAHSPKPEGRMLGERLRDMIQARVSETGSPEASDATCSAMKLKHGSTADVADRHDKRVARQMRTLCPAYFTSLERSEKTNAPPMAARKDGAYTDSKDLCGIFGVEQVASEYGGDLSDPASVAQAYANESYQASFRESAQKGCLAGLAK